jgi:chromatin assembly factor 1 subunit A
MQSQMKLNAFFMKPMITLVPSPSAINLHAPNKTLANNDVDPTTLLLEPGGGISDYHREFPEFFIQSFTRVAPVHRFERDLEALGHVHKKLDDLLQCNTGDRPQLVIFRPSELLHVIPYKRLWGSRIIPVKDIVSKLHSFYNTVDLTSETSTEPVECNPKELLKKVPMKILRFGEDVRPPYHGTFTKALSRESALKLSRNPFYHALQDTNYDYDSEAEWEEPEDGEDLDSEREEETSEDGDDDLEGFLDDENDCQAEGRRRLIAGDLVPVCSGIRWQEMDTDPEFQAYKMEIISGMEFDANHSVFPQTFLTTCQRDGKLPNRSILYSLLE